MGGNYGQEGGKGENGKCSVTVITRAILLRGFKELIQSVHWTLKALENVLKAFLKT